jgi:hypothetical protein
MPNLIGGKGEKAPAEIGFTKQLVSMDHQACGALNLWNYPTFLRDLIVQHRTKMPMIGLLVWTFTYQLHKVVLDKAEKFKIFYTTEFNIN